MTNNLLIKYGPIMKAYQLLATICLFSITTLANASTITGIYVFGDSLSDNGNMYALSQHNIPSVPYADGRFSNGQVWVEYLNTALGLPPNSLNDYAFGGSLTNSDQPPGLIQQSSNYLDNHLNLDPQGLYIIWSGANNYLYPDEVEISDKTIQHAVNDIIYTITELASRGAHHILVINLPPMGDAPWGHIVDQQRGNNSYSTMLNVSSSTHNKKLLTAITNLQTQYHKNHQLVHLMHFDAHKLFRQIMTEKMLPGITDYQHPCYTGDLFGRNGSLCEHPESYLFWDTVHPTTKMHETFAEYIADALHKDGITGANVLSKQYGQAYNKHRMQHFMPQTHH